MKIAALYDIHGNLPALNAVLQEIAELQPDLIVVGGDILSGPMPDQTLERLLQLGPQVRFIRGNADREVLETFDGQPIQRRYMPAATEKDLEINSWLASQLTRAQRDLLAEMPEQLELEIEGLGKVLFCHATPRNDEDLFTPLTPESRLRTLFAGIEQEMVICGHTHSQYELKVDTLRIVNAGSVGMPYEEQTGAYWLWLDPQGLSWHRTAYDLEAAAQEIRATKYPSAQQFVEEYVLHIYTARETSEFFESIAIQD